MKINFTGGFIKIAKNGAEKYINVDTIRKIFSNENAQDENERGKTAIYYSNNYYCEVVETPASKVAAACIKAQTTGQIVDIAAKD